MLRPFTAIAFTHHPKRQKNGSADFFQTSVLNALYFINPYPTYEEKAKFADLIKMKYDCVYNWFKYHRSLNTTSKKISTSTKPSCLESGKIFHSMSFMLQVMSLIKQCYSH